METSITWDGVRRAETLKPAVAAERQKLADAARRFDWPAVLAIVAESPSWVNATRLNGDSLFTPMHQAAYGGADRDTVAELVRLGGWRTLREREGKRPIDIARERGFGHLETILTPEYRTAVPLAVLAGIQAQFHEVIRSRAAKLVDEHGLRLPELEVMLEFSGARCWFPIPGMYGGFGYWLEGTGTEAVLTTESWCRVVGGSEQRHVVTATGWSEVPFE